MQLEFKSTPEHESSAPRWEGKRWALGPGRTRGTIELLCRGGVGGRLQPRWRFPLWRDTKHLRLSLTGIRPSVLSGICQEFSVICCVVGTKRTAEPGLEVRWWECGQYARVFSVPGFAPDGFFLSRPQGLLIFPLSWEYVCFTVGERLATV